MPGWFSLWKRSWYSKNTTYEMKTDEETSIDRIMNLEIKKQFNVQYMYKYKYWTFSTPYPFLFIRSQGSTFLFFLLFSLLPSVDQWYRGKVNLFLGYVNPMDFMCKVLFRIVFLPHINLRFSTFCYVHWFSPFFSNKIFLSSPNTSTPIYLVFISLSHTMQYSKI